MWRQVRCKKLSLAAPLGRPDVSVGVAKAASDLLGVYAGLAERGAHLLGDLLAGAPPVQWERLPDADAVDSAGRYQWFYHSHAPEDRPSDSEHGHIHLFARRAIWEGLSATPEEGAFRKLCGKPRSNAGTRHLIAIGFDAKGLPISLFAVNSWVTDDLMLSTDSTVRLLAEIDLDTGHPEIDAMIVSLIRLCQKDIETLLDERDRTLASRPPRGVLDDRALEILAEIPLNLDAKMANLLG